MGALETLYALIYGSSPEGRESDLLEAPNRLKLYALQKLLQGSNAYGDIVDSNADWGIDREVRLSGELPFEGRQNKKRQTRAEYARQKLEELKAKEASISAPSPSKGGPASGGVIPPTDVVAAEKTGETAGDRAISAYKAADKIGGDYTDFSSFMADYVRRAERDTAAENAYREANPSVKIYIPGGYEGLQRIRQQAGGTPGGGTFSVAGGVTGGDTEEDTRAYVDNYRNTEVDRQIGLIERAFPAANRPPALDARLQDLYTARANRDQSLAETGRTAVLGRQAEAQMLGSEADMLSAQNAPGIAQTQAAAQVASAQAYAGNRTSVDEVSLQKFVVELGKNSDEYPEIKSILPKIKMIAYDRTKSPDQRYNEIVDILNAGGQVESNSPQLSERNRKLFDTED
jgi:hypothetical protein